MSTGAASDNLSTVGELLETSIKELNATSPSARLDAELLVSHALECPRTFVHTHAGEIVAPVVIAQVRELIGRRRAGEPVAYILGTREFWSLELEVTPAALMNSRACATHGKQ